MPKLPSIKPRQIIRFLEQNGLSSITLPEVISSITTPYPADAQSFPTQP
jgi:hypothetical protein